MSDDNKSPRPKRSRSGSDSGDERRFSKRRTGGSGERIELRMIIRSRDAGAVIGRGGANVKRLREEFRASITVTDSRTPERLIVIVSDEAGMTGVLNEILKALDENAVLTKTRSSRGRDETEGKMLIHQSQAGCVIGRAGTKLKEFRHDMGVDIKVFSDCCPRSTERVILVAGKPQNVSKCMVSILVMLQTWPPRGFSDPYDPANYDEVAVRDYGGYLDDDGERGRRGRGGGGDGGGGYGGGRGDRMDSRRSRGFGGGSRDRGDRGDRGGSGGGLAGLGGLGMMLGQRLNQRMTQQVSIPADMAGVIIGKSGQNIRRIRIDTGADVELDDAGGGHNDRIITIHGTPEQITNAQYMLQMSVKQHLARN